jgi:hypothetical protein
VGERNAINYRKNQKQIADTQPTYNNLFLNNAYCEIPYISSKTLGSQQHHCMHNHPKHMERDKPSEGVEVTETF